MATKPGARVKARAPQYWRCHDCRIAVECGKECWRCGNPEQPVEVTCGACGWRGPANTTGACSGCGNISVRQEPGAEERTARDVEAW